MLRAYFFKDANSPVIEYLIYFHDHTMCVIISIMCFLLTSLLFIILRGVPYYTLLADNHILELFWTTAPVLLLVVIAAPSLRLLYLIEERFSPFISIKIIGHQWYWRYEYTDFNICFDRYMIPNRDLFRLLYTDNSVYLPVNTFIRLLITSYDVIHSWTIQTLGLKIDAIPGRLNQITTTSERCGVFFGQCSEICGRNHSFIPITIKLVKIPVFINQLLIK